MGMINIRSSVTGKTSLVSESAYNSFFKNISIYTIIEDKPNVEETKEIETKEVKPEKEPEVIKPIKPLKSKPDISQINSEV